MRIKNFLQLIILVIFWSYTKTESSMLHGSGKKVCCGGGGWWWVCKPIVMFSLGFDQAEQKESIALSLNLNEYLFRLTRAP